MIGGKLKLKSKFQEKINAENEKTKKLREKIEDKMNFEQLLKNQSQKKEDGIITYEPEPFR